MQACRAANFQHPVLVELLESQGPWWLSEWLGERVVGWAHVIPTVGLRQQRLRPSKAEAGRGRHDHGGWMSLADLQLK